MGNFVSSDVVIESDAITGVIDSKLILDHLTLSDPSVRESLVHIKGGTKVFNVNRILQGLDPVSVEEEGKRSDDKDPACDEKGLGCLGAEGAAHFGRQRRTIHCRGDGHGFAWRRHLLAADRRLRHGNSPDWPGRAGVVD